MAEEKRCPSCDRTLPEDLTAQFCPYCGAALGDEHGAASALGEIAWESESPELSLIQRLTDTWTESVFHPSQFFRKLQRRGSAGKALLYAVVFIIMGQAFSVFWQQMFFENIREMMGEMFPMLAEYMVPNFGSQLLIAPVFSLLGLLLMTLVYHLCLLLVGAGENGMEATFRALAYAEGAQLWQVIPFLGQLLSMIWGIVMIVIGMREAHATTTGRAVAAFFIPLAFCCIVVGFLALMVGSIVTN